MQNFVGNLKAFPFFFISLSINKICQKQPNLCVGCQRGIYVNMCSNIYTQAFGLWGWLQVQQRGIQIDKKYNLIMYKIHHTVRAFILSPQTDSSIM